MDQFVNSPNHTPSMQKFMQKNTDLVFLKTPKDRAVFKFLMGTSFVVATCVLVGIQNMATGTNKVKRS